MNKIEKQYLRELLDDYAEMLHEDRLRPSGDRMLPTPGLDYRKGLLLGYCAAFRLDLTQGNELIIRNTRKQIVAAAPATPEKPEEEKR